MIVAAGELSPTKVRRQWYSYLDRPEWQYGDPDKRTVELVNGTEVEKKMGAFETGLANDLHSILDPFVRGGRLGRAFVAMEIELITIDAKRRPDVCFVSNATWPIDLRIPPGGWWAVTPELAVEVVSPYELTHATFAKLQEYFAAGVRAVWLILPNVEQVYCYSSPTSVRILTRDDELIGDPVVPGFRMAVADLFPPIAGESAG